jgi:sensor c-di-GMP phosphodiesterase-like protein
MQHSDNSTEDLQALRDLGVQVSIDDFGTGYSSLSYLKRLPIDTLKIDKSFIQDVSDNSHDAAIASAIIDMARSLQLNVVAEGVETEAQVRFLQRKGCGLVQGYYFGQALPLEDMEELLRGGGILAPPSGD